MIQALAALLGASLTAASCYAAGRLLIDHWGLQLQRFERFPLSFTLGASVLHQCVRAVDDSRGGVAGARGVARGRHCLSDLACQT